MADCRFPALAQPFVSHLHLYSCDCSERRDRRAAILVRTFNRALSAGAIGCPLSACGQSAPQVRSHNPLMRKEKHNGTITAE
jgi:hypothetical protein